MRLCTILILLSARQSAATTPAPNPPSAAPTQSQQTIMMAGPDEVGSRWIIRRPGNTTVWRSAVAYKTDGTPVVVTSCKPNGAIRYARTARHTDVPNSWLTTNIGVILESSRLPYIQLMMGAGDCYIATRSPEPVKPGIEWWAKPGSTPVDMSRGGGTPQCSGPCPWYTHLAE